MKPCFTVFCTTLLILGFGKYLPADDPAADTPSARWAFELGHELNDVQRRELFDQFEFELAVLDVSNRQITYISQVSSPTPKTRGAAGEEERFYVGGNRMPEYLQPIFKKLQVDYKDEKKIVLVFFSAETEKRLLKLEEEANRVKRPLRQTLFRATKTDDGYEFYVAAQAHEGDSTPLHENKLP